MKYADILCINEHEAAASTGIRLRDQDERLILENIPKALHRFKELGVRRWAAIHAPEGGLGLDENDTYHVVPGAVVPKEFIAGTVGAGDAFASGLLLGAYRDRPMEEALEYAIAAAVTSLSKADASEGVLELAEALKLLGTFERRAF
jgi:sugar/nucleoside kinase (ribokinase family)